MSGVANPLLSAAGSTRRQRTRTCIAAGSGLGAGGFIVFDDDSDLVAVAHAVARFLAVESCGQCEPCKLDGLAIAEHLDAIRTSNATERDLTAVEQKLQTVARGACCFLAHQHQRVVASFLAEFPDAFAEHITGHRASVTSQSIRVITQ